MGKIQISKICNFCRITYIDCPTRRKKFCSNNCRRESWKVWNKQHQGQRSSLRFWVDCLVCNKKFQTIPSVSSKYCSYKCKYSDHARITNFERGEKRWNWLGGITPEEKKIRQLRKYGDWRMSILKRDDYHCQICGQYGGKLQADHIKPFKLFPGLRFDIKNGQTLCINCHYIKNGEDIKNYGYKGNWKEVKYAFVG